MVEPPIRFSPDVEQVQPDEAETQQALIETFRSIIDTTTRIMAMPIEASMPRATLCSKAN